MAEGETGLGRRQLVEVVQPYHIRHLKLGLTRETESKSWRQVRDTYFLRERSSRLKDTENDENKLLLQPLFHTPKFSFTSPSFAEK